jgi:hypothetical protein
MSFFKGNDEKTSQKTLGWTLTIQKPSPLNFLKKSFSVVVVMREKCWADIVFRELQNKKCT